MWYNIRAQSRRLFYRGSVQFNSIQLERPSCVEKTQLCLTLLQAPSKAQTHTQHCKPPQNKALIFQWHLDNGLNYLCCGWRSSTLDRKSSSCSGMKWHFEIYPGPWDGPWSPISAAGDWKQTDSYYEVANNLFLADDRWLTLDIIRSQHNSCTQWALQPAIILSYTVKQIRLFTEWQVVELLTVLL